MGFIETVNDAIWKAVGRRLEQYGYLKAAETAAYMGAMFAGEHSPVNPLANVGAGDKQTKAERLAVQSSWVFSNVDLIATTASLAKYTVWDWSDDALAMKPVPEHPFHEVMRRPNPHMGTNFLLTYTAMWYQLRGEAFWMLVPDKTGELKEIWPLPSNRITPVSDPDTYIKGFLYKYKDRPDKYHLLRPEDVCYFRYPNPFDYHRGLSRMTPLLMALETDAAASSWNKQTFVDDVTLKQLFSLPENINRSNFQRIKAEIVDELNNGSRYMVVRGGELKAEQIGLSQREAEYLSGREFTRDEIDRAFKIPNGFWAKNTTEANAKVAFKVLIQLVIEPLVRSFQEQMTTQVIDRFYDELGTRQEVRTGTITPVDEEQALATTQYEDQAKTIDEVRERQGLKTYGGTYGRTPWPMRNSVTVYTSLVIGPEHLLRVSDILNDTGNARDDGTGADGSEGSDLQNPFDQDADGIPDELEGELREETTGSAEGDAKAGPIDTKEAAEDIRRWKSISARLARRGRTPAEYQFESIHIDPDIRRNITTALAFTENEKETKAVFSHWREMEVKSTGIFQTGKAELDGILSEFNDELWTVIISGANGEMSEGAIVSRLSGISRQYAAKAILAGSNTDASGLLPTNLGSRLDDAKTYSPVAARAFAEDIVAGVYTDISRYATAAAAIAALEAGSGEDTLAAKQKAENRIQSRVNLWLAFIASMYSFGQTGKAGVDLTWRRGITIEPCETCLSLDGQTKSAEEWSKLGVYPQARNGSLKCGGWYCDCFFEES